MAENRWFKAVTKSCVVVGANGGLGSALVDELIAKGVNQVVGIARTSQKNLPNSSRWLASERYRHVQVDIGSPDSVVAMSAVLAYLPREPLLVIFNAARLMKDTRDDGSIDFDIFDEVNRTGINGLRNVLKVFEDHLLSMGGTFVGISSISALMPPVLEEWVAYPATKAYLDMALRCAQIAWQGKVSFVIIHLGHTGRKREGGLMSPLFQPTYAATADKIVRLVLRSRVPRQMTHPFAYALAYRGVMRFLPDSTYYQLLRFLLKLSGSA